MRLEKVTKLKGKEMVTVKWIRPDGRPHRCIYTDEDEDKFENDLGTEEANKHKSKIKWKKKPQ